ncbi:MAG: kynureninase [Bacteroidales bacterium]
MSNRLLLPGELDAADPLRSFRDEFLTDDPDLIYLDGNSLGRLPVRTVELMRQMVEHEWGGRLIRGWNEEWMALSERIGGKIARLIGAGEDEVILTDSTSLNLFKLAFAAMQYQGDRDIILTDSMNFPSDLYVIQGLDSILTNDCCIEVAESRDGITMDEEALLERVGDGTALVTLTHVAFKSAFKYDMGRITEGAHSKGALVLWDLSHAAGAVPVDLNGAGADLAVGCTYKYMNGGPGSVAFLYVRKDLQDKLINPIWGWFAEQDPFEFTTGFRAASGMRRFLVSTPPVLSARATEPGIDLLLEAGMDRIRSKSIAQSEYLIALFDEYLAPLGFQLGSPRDPAIRGSHVSIRHPEAFRINQAMIHPPDGARVVIPDFRSPDNIRLGIAPLYTTFKDIYDAIHRIRQIVSEGIYLNMSAERGKVT